MTRFFRAESLAISPEGVEFLQEIEIFDPKSGRQKNRISIEILPGISKSSAAGISRFQAAIVHYGKRGETIEGLYALHEGFGCFDTFPVDVGLQPELEKLVQGQMYLIPS